MRGRPRVPVRALVVLSLAAGLPLVAAAPALATNPTFAAPLNRSTANAPVKDLAVGDVNGDGKLDMVATSSDFDAVQVFLGDGTGAFASADVYILGNDYV